MRWRYLVPMTEKRNIRHNPVLFGIVLAVMLTIVIFCAVFLQNAPGPDQNNPALEPKQTLEDIEIIAVDDGSTDDTLNQLKRYESDPRVRVIAKQNSGFTNSMIQIPQ